MPILAPCFTSGVRSRIDRIKIKVLSIETVAKVISPTGTVWFKLELSRDMLRRIGKSASLSPPSHQQLDVPHEPGGAGMINDADADLIARARFDDLGNIRQACPHS